jgi:hypothetical protein
LKLNYNSNETNLAGQLISACQGMRACDNVFLNPAGTFEALASQLRSAVGTYLRIHPQAQRAYVTENPITTTAANDEDDEIYYTDRRYGGNDNGRRRGGYNNYRGKSRGGYRGSYNRGNISNGKRCFICDKPGCWSTKHPRDEQRNTLQQFRSYAKNNNITEDYGAFLLGFEGLEIDGSDDPEIPSSRTKVLDAHYYDSDTPTSENQQFLTTCGHIDGQLTTMKLNDVAAMHAITGVNPYNQEAKEQAHLFVFHSRYDGEIFQGIMPDTGAAGVSTAGEPQVKALQKRFPKVTLNTTTAGQQTVRFGDGPEKFSLGTFNVDTPFGVVDFVVMPTNTPFLFCLADMDRHGVYFNNIHNVLVHNGKDCPVIRKWGHPWLLLEDLESTVAHCHLTEGELRQLHRRFGHPAADRLHRVLSRAGYDDIDESILVKTNKYCHQCQMHSRAPGRFRFTIRDDADFNYRLIVDIMYINTKPVLHAVDEATAFQAARFLANMKARTAWDTLRAMWIDTYVGPPDIIVTDAGTNFVGENFVDNARIMAIEVEEIPVEAHHSIGKVERYHAPIRRAFEVITADLGNKISPDNALQMAVKAVNDTAGPDGLVPTLLVFGTFPRISQSSWFRPILK